MANAKTRWTHSVARELLAEQQASGLCIAQFAEARGLDPKRFYRWRQRLNSIKGPSTPPPIRPQDASLVPVEVVPPRAATTREVAADRARLTLHTKTGHTIDVGAGFDGDTLLRILDVLAAAERC